MVRGFRRGHLRYARRILRRALIASGIVVAAVGGAIWAWIAVERSHARAEHERELALLDADVAVAATEFVTCVLGDDPTVAFERVRLAEELSPTPGGQWPVRCAPYALNMIAIAAKSVDAGVPRAIGPMKDVDGELRNGSTEHLMEAVTAVKPIATKKADTRVPRPSAPLGGGIAGGSPMYGRDPKAAIESIDQLDGELHVTLARSNAHASCVIDGTSFAVHCTPDIDGVHAVIAYEKGGAATFWRLPAEGVVSGAVDVTGKLLLEGDILIHGHSYADGRLVALTNAISGSAVLSTRAKDGTITKRPSEYGSSNPRGAADFVVWKSVDGDDANDPATVKALHLADGTVRALGKVERRPDRTTSSSGHCASATTLFVDMSPSIAVLGPKDAATLVKAEAQPDDAERGMACEGSSLRILDASASALRVQDCDATACKTKSGAIDVADGVRVASLGPDDYMLVWRKRWGVIAARAALDGFGAATPFAIATLEPRVDPLDDQLGFIRNIDTTTRVVSVPGGAIVFTQVMSKLHAFAVRRDGSVSPIVDVP